VCPKAGAPPRMRLRNRKIDAICPKKVPQRRSDGHLGEAEAVNQTFLSIDIICIKPIGHQTD
ncbi:MAG: hypothetical protein Q8J98_11105, partial [Phaeovulum sp.]|uniref:hypothetical protein n=1 Tax=Phaeovulum sp. TaxID=2934796 RepID=UPI0027314937